MLYMNLTDILHSWHDVNWLFICIAVFKEERVQLFP